VSDRTDRRRRRGTSGSGFITLWVLVSGIWTVATCLRIHRVWVPSLGWPAVLTSTFTWVSLLTPPLMFAVILLAVSRIASARHRSGG